MGEAVRELTFRLIDTADPEERLEEAALWKAMHDEYGDEIRAVTGDVPATFGRPRRIDSLEPLAYWDDPAFISACGRPFEVMAFEKVLAQVDFLHQQGLGAFIKSTREKHSIFRVPVGSNAGEVIGDMAYSFMDGGPLLMVQALVTMRYEWRFFVIGREIATHSPNASHLTPIDFPCRDIFATPATREPAIFRKYEALLESYFPLARRIAAEMKQSHAVIDLAMIGGIPGCVELNPLHLGGIGLFACDVRALARASRWLRS